MEEERSRLADLIEKHAISYSNEPFTLASGAKSNFYFDLRQVSGDAEGITAIARIMYNMINEIGGIKSVGGLESGSISLAAAISQYSYTKNPSSDTIDIILRTQAGKITWSKKNCIEGRPSPLFRRIDDCQISLQRFIMEAFLAQAMASIPVDFFPPYVKTSYQKVLPSCSKVATFFESE